MDHSSVISGVIKPCVTCDKNSMLHNGGTFDGSDMTRISVSDFPLSSANTTRFFVLNQHKRRRKFRKLDKFNHTTFSFLFLGLNWIFILVFLQRMHHKKEYHMKKNRKNYCHWPLTVALTFDVHLLTNDHCPNHYCANVHVSLNKAVSVRLAFYSLIDETFVDFELALGFVCDIKTLTDQNIWKK